MKRFATALCLLGICAPIQAQQEKALHKNAQQKKAEQGKVPQQIPANASTELKRKWLRENVIERQRDPRVAKTYTEQLARMTPQQVDALVSHYQRTLAAQQNRSKTKVTAAERNAAIRRYQQRLAASRRNVGFAPVITWLPSGASLNAGAVVSPDRRYVRMSLNPFFSSVPYFDTFNMSNGQTRRYYLDRQTPTSGFGGPSYLPQRRPTATRRPTTPTRPIPSWYRRVRSR